MIRSAASLKYTSMPSWSSTNIGVARFDASSRARISGRLGGFDGDERGASVTSSAYEGRWIACEGPSTPLGAEPERAPVVLELLRGGVDVDGHPAHRVGGLVARRGVGRDGAPFTCRATGDEVGQDGDRDLDMVDRAEVESGRRVHAREHVGVDAVGGEVRE